MEIIEKVSTSSSCLMGTFPDADWLAVLPKYKLRDNETHFVFVLIKASLVDLMDAL